MKTESVESTQYIAVEITSMFRMTARLSETDLQLCSYKRTLFSLIFLTVLSADDIELNVCLNLYIYMGNSLVVFWTRFLLPLRFWLKMQKTTFLKINGY